MEKIIINGEKIFLKKGFDGWRVIYPTRNEDGSRNWKHFLVGSSYWNIVKLTAILLVVLFLMWSYNRDLAVCSDIANTALKNPCKWCELTRMAGNNYNPQLINVTKLLIDAKIDDSSV